MSLAGGMVLVAAVLPLAAMLGTAVPGRGRRTADSERIPTSLYGNAA
jgi:hypothetical protein